MLSSGGNVESTILQLVGVERYVAGLNAIAHGWESASHAQDVYGRSAHRASQAGNLLTAGLTAPLAGVIALTAKLGIAAVESESLVKTTFGNMTADINRWSNQTAKALGLNAYEMRRQAGLYQQMFTGAEIDPTKAEKMSKTLVDLRNDLVSFYNVSNQEAGGTLQSLLGGETEPGHKFGLFLTEATVKSYAYKNGIAAANSELTEQQKILARFGYIQSTLQRNKVVGDLERTKDSPANRLRRMQAEWEQAGTDFGMALVPLAQPGIKLLNDLTPPLRTVIDLFTRLPQPIQASALALGLGAGPALKLGGFLLNLKQAKSLTTIATKGLTAATVADTIAEKAKAAVARDEGAAIGGVGKAATDTAGKLGLLARARGFLSSGATVGGFAIPQVEAFGMGGGVVSKGGALTGAALGVGAGLGAHADMRALGYSEGASTLYAGITGAVTAGLTTIYPPARLIVGAAELFRLGVDRFVSAPLAHEAETGGSGGRGADAIARDKRAGLLTDDKEAKRYLELSKKTKGEADAIKPLWDWRGGDIGRMFYPSGFSKKEKRGKAAEAESYRLTAAGRQSHTLFEQREAEEKKRHIAGVPAPPPPSTSAILGRLIARPAENGAYERGPLGRPIPTGSDPSFQPWFSPVARNYGEQGLDPNAYYKQRLAALATPNGGTTRATVTERRDGKTIVELPAREADLMAEQLKTHNRLRTHYGR